MKHVLVIPGDGIGPEVILPTVKVLSTIAPSLEFEIRHAGKDEFLRTGTSISEELIDNARSADAILFGATTCVRDDRYRSPILVLRKELGLFANVRIAKNLIRSEKRIDIVVIRENTEGLYTGKEEMDDHGVTTFRRISKDACARIVRFAFDWCVKNDRRKILCAHKANVLRLSDGLFLDTFKTEAMRYPDIQASDALIDSTAMKMVMTPEEFDVLVTLNLYGDILSDLAAGLIGGLGFMPSANFGTRNALFEPAHGSAPDIVGKGLANPFASLLSGAMLLEYFDMKHESRALISSIEKTANQIELVDRLGRCNTTNVIAGILENLNHDT
jgi:methanogen homoisocitrate dehydrogenase